MKRSATSAEKEHLGRVAAMGCVVCEVCLGCDGTPAHAHHVHVNFGWGRTSHMATLPLCPLHHTGKFGVHNMGKDTFTAMYGKSEMDLLGIVNERLGVSLEDHMKEAHKAAKTIAKGDLSKTKKAKVVSKWAAHMKAILKTKSKRGSR